MSEDWREVNVDDVTTVIQRGKAPAYVDSGGTLVVNQKCIRGGRVDLDLARRTDSTAKPIPAWALLSAGDILVNSTGTGTVGRAGFVRPGSEPVTVDSHVTIVRPNPELVVPRFLALVLETRQSELEDRATGSTNQVELSGDAIGSVHFGLPPIHEQNRIVGLLESVDRALIAARRVHVSARATRLAIMAELLDRTEASASLAEILIPIKNEVILEDDQHYATVGVLSYGRGLFERPVITGAHTSYRSYFRIKAGQFVYSKLFAWEGALAVVPASFDGYFVSQEFPTFDIDETKALPLYVEILCQWEPTWKRVRAGETGMGGRRKRVHPDRLLQVIVPLPTIAEQEHIVDLLAAVQDTAIAAEAEGESILQVRTGLLEDLLAGRHTIPDGYDHLLEGAGWVA